MLITWGWWSYIGSTTERWDQIGNFGHSRLKSIRGSGFDHQPFTRGRPLRISPLASLKEIGILACPAPLRDEVRGFLLITSILDRIPKLRMGVPAVQLLPREQREQLSAIVVIFTMGCLHLLLQNPPVTDPGHMGDCVDTFTETSARRWHVYSNAENPNMDGTHIHKIT